jgi:hypothetical protein
MFKVLGIILMLLAVGLIAVPRFTDCESQGKAIETATDGMVPMKCHWAGIAEIGVAIPMYVVAAVMIINRRRKTLTFLSLLGMVLGGLAIAFPTRLIGVCSDPMMLCSTVMKPVLVLLGGGAILASGTGLGITMAKSFSKASQISMLALIKKATALKGV